MNVKTFKETIYLLLALNNMRFFGSAALFNLFAH
jgi:hypothetical protein